MGFLDLFKLIPAEPEANLPIELDEKNNPFVTEKRAPRQYKPKGFFDDGMNSD